MVEITDELAIYPIELAARSPSFTSLLELHSQLDETFAQHQEAVVLGDVARAEELLRDFASALRSHIRFEEECLFPIYERAGSISGGGVSLYLNEHAKLLRYVERIDEDLRMLHRYEWLTARRRIALLDFEARFKNLMVHHDARERNILYPTLDLVATPEERALLLSDTKKDQ